MDKRYYTYEIVNEINYEQDLIVVRSLFDNDDLFNYGLVTFYNNYTIISSARG